MAEILPPDPWATLGVAKDAEPATIRSAYRKLVLKHHPDRQQHAAAELREQALEKFQLIHGAYEILRDPSRLARYTERVRLAELRKENLQRRVPFDPPWGFRERPAPSVRDPGTKFPYSYPMRTAPERRSPTSSPSWRYPFAGLSLGDPKEEVRGGSQTENPPRPVPRPATSPPPNQWQIRSPKEPQVTRCMLDLKVEGQTESAVADTGAHENMISDTLVRQLGLRVETPQNNTHQFVNPVGESMKTSGYVDIKCNFQGRDSSDKDDVKTRFWVLPKMIVPLLVGQKFLDSTGLLTRFKHLLKRLVAPRGVSLRVLHMELPRWRLECKVGHASVLGNPDTGSDLDLMSAAFRRDMGFDMKPVDDEHGYIEFADGTTKRLQGVVSVPFSVGAKDHPPQTKQFYVLEGLTTEIILGDATLDDLDVFNTCREAFVNLEERDVFSDFHFIRWAQRSGRTSYLDAEFADFDFSPTSFSPPSSSKQGFRRFFKSRASQTPLIPDLLTVAESRHRAQEYLAFKDDSERLRVRREALRIAGLPLHCRAAEQALENRLQARYERDRADFVARHDVAVALALSSSSSVTSSRSGSGSGSASASTSN